MCWSRTVLTPDREVALIGTGTTSNILTAMKAGTVDAGVLSPPFNAMATQMGYRTLAYFGDYVEQSLSGARNFRQTDPRATGSGTQNVERYDQKLALHSATADGVDPIHQQRMEREFGFRDRALQIHAARVFEGWRTWTKKASAKGSSARPSAWRSKMKRRCRACWICGC